MSIKVIFFSLFFFSVISGLFSPASFRRWFWKSQHSLLTPHSITYPFFHVSLYQTVLQQPNCLVCSIHKTDRILLSTLSCFIPVTAFQPAGKYMVSCFCNLSLHVYNCHLILRVYTALQLSDGTPYSTFSSLCIPWSWSVLSSPLSLLSAYSRYLSNFPPTIAFLNGEFGYRIQINPDFFYHISYLSLFVFVPTIISFFHTTLIYWLLVFLCSFNISLSAFFSLSSCFTFYLYTFMR